ncbi:MAG TPA: DUF1566 domain-containing protein [Polyangium sp.]|nr:DUF1566 domain-containing protein [Polyangium sp.]
MLNKWFGRAFGLIIGVVITVMGVARVAADAPDGQYEIAGGTVYDTKSKLTWEQSPSTSTRTWDSAKMYCQNLALGGSGWRLPSAKELMSIVDETRDGPAIDSTAFPGTMPTWYWTSSPNKSKTPDIWNVDFSTGYMYSTDPTYGNLVRCVR